MDMNAERMLTLTKGLPTKSAKIRRLADAGVERADIARFLGIRYQFVHNVLVAYKAKRPSGAGHGRQAANEELGSVPITLTLGPGGTVALPDSVVGVLGAAAGDSLIATAEDGVVQLMTVAAAVRKAQAIVRKHIPAGVSLVDDLLRDRRDEAEKAGASG